MDLDLYMQVGVHFSFLFALVLTLKMGSRCALCAGYFSTECLGHSPEET